MDKEQLLKFDKLKVDVYEEFGYDLAGCEQEIMVMAYVCQAACDARFKNTQEIISNSLTQFNIVSDTFNLGFKSGIDVLVTHLENQQTLIGEKTKDVFESQKSKVEKELLLSARKALTQVFEENGVTLNSRLSTVINELQTVSDETKHKSQSVANTLKGIALKISIYSFSAAAIATSLTFILLLLLQNSGVINIPLQINLNAKSVADYIIQSMN